MPAPPMAPHPTLDSSALSKMSSAPPPASTPHPTSMPPPATTRHAPNNLLAAPAPAGGYGSLHDRVSNWQRTAAANADEFEDISAEVRSFNTKCRA
jgi:hypothetical protein